MPFKSKERKRKYDREYCTNNKHVWRKYRRKIRRRVLDHYGRKCVCCGETTEEFLAVDHIERRIKGEKRKGGYAFYLWLIKNDFPEGFQVLCHNCNLAKGYYGCCPHKLKSV